MSRVVRVWLAVAAVVVTACHDEPGLLIEVVPNDSATREVELLLAVGPCDSCTTGMGLPGAAAKTPGHVWYLDSAARLSAPVEADGRARFLLKPGATDQVQRLIAVGLDANGQATGYDQVTDVKVPPHARSYWRLLLGSATFVPAAVPTGLDATDRVELWEQPADPANPQAPPDHASCLAILHGDGTGDFFAAPDDPDCDRITDPALECDPTWYRHTVAGTQPTLCWTQPPASACQVGSTVSCVDGVGASSCQSMNLCVPDAVCGTCLNNANPIYNDTCAIAQLMSTATAGLTCHVPYDADSACNGGAGSLGTVTLPLTGCTDIKFVTGTSPLSIVPSPTLNVAPGNGNLLLTIGNQMGCSFDFSLLGNLASGNSNTTIAARKSLLVVTVDLGHGPATLVIPFTAEFNQNCGGSGADPASMITCALSPAPGATTDGVWTCGM